jgi:hypothetical protein
MLSANPLEKRFQIAGICLILGLLVEAVCPLTVSDLCFGTKIRAGAPSIGLESWAAWQSHSA